MSIFTSPLPRRSVLRLLTGSLLSLVGAQWLLPGRAAASGAPQLIRQLVGRDLSTGRIVMWQTDSLPKQARLRLRGGGMKNYREFIPGYTFLATAEELPYVFYAVLEGLTPGRQYSYQIACDEATSDWLPLWTPHETGTCSALLFSDPQSTDGYAGFRRLLLRALLRHKHTSLLLLTGDLVDNGAADWYWQQFLSAWDGVAGHLPLAPALGNHECYNAEWQPMLPQDYLARLKTPANGSQSGWEGHYYSYDWSNVHFAVLDTQEEEEGGFRPGLLAEQATWLRRDMAASQKKWRVIVMHRDILDYETPSAGPEAFTDIGKFFLPLFEELKVNLVLSGHLHIYRRRCPIKGFRPASQGPGPLYICCGVSGNDRGYKEVRSPFDVATERDEREACYIQLLAGQQELTVNAFTGDGTLLDTVSLTR